MGDLKNRIFLIGPMGSGKTTVGKKLASMLGKTFCDTDNEVELKTGVNISYIFDVEGEEGFRKRESVVLFEKAQLTRRPRPQKKQRDLLLRRCPVPRVRLKNLASSARLGGLLYLCLRNCCDWRNSG